MQSGGAKCKLCKSEGANKATCPLNPNAIKYKPQKHYMLLLNKSKPKTKYKSKSKSLTTSSSSLKSKPLPKPINKTIKKNDKHKLGPI